MAGSGLFFMDSFDHYDATNADLEQKWNSVTGANLDTTTKRTGRASALLVGASAELGFSDLGQGNQYIGLAGAFRIDDVGAQPVDPDNNSQPILATIKHGSFLQDWFYLTIDGGGQLWTENAALPGARIKFTSGLNGTGVPTPDVRNGWRYIEWVNWWIWEQGFVTPVRGQLWVDGMPFQAGLGLENQQAALPLVTAQAYFNAVSGTVYLDDAYVCDQAELITAHAPEFGDTITGHGHLGDIDIQVLYPNGDGASNPTDWTPSAGTSHSALVDEQPGDANFPLTTDFVSTASASVAETFDMDNPTTNGEQGWHALQAVAFAKTSQTGTEDNLSFVRTSSSASGATNSIGTSDLDDPLGTEVSSYSYHTAAVHNDVWDTWDDVNYDYAKWAALTAQTWGVKNSTVAGTKTVAQFCVEVAAPLAEEPAQLSQLVVEIARPIIPAAQLSQLILEIAQSTVPILPEILAQVSQLIIEVAQPGTVPPIVERTGKKPFFYECVARDNGGAGFDAKGIFIRCLAARNTTDGFIDPITIAHGVTYKNTANGVSFSHGTPATMIDLVNVDNAVGYSFDETSATPFVYLIRCSDTGNTTRLSGNTLSVITEIDGKTITADPFSDPTNNNFGLDSDGEPLVGDGVQFKGIPGTTSFHDHQAWQQQCAVPDEDQPFTDTMTNRSMH